VPLPTAGRVHQGTRRVRFGDVGPAGGLRLDALAAYLQDLSSDDTVDAGLGDDPWWVVRRAVVEVHGAGAFRELLTLRTACSGLGSRWAERRVSVAGDAGASAEAATLWVRLDAVSGRPAPLDEPFLEAFGPAAAGREVHARLQHEVEPPDGAERWPWPTRYADLDPLGHVNNAVSWAIAEEVLARSGGRTTAERPVGGLRVEVEFRRPIEPGDAVEVAVAPAVADEPVAGIEVAVAPATAGEPGPRSLDWWALDPASPSSPYLTGRIRPLPRG
jgi:acyl-ACP thioesterase